jgi:hypothetical protein
MPIEDAPAITKKTNTQSKLAIQAITSCFLLLATLSSPQLAYGQGSPSIGTSPSSSSTSSTLLAQNFPLPPTSSTIIPTDVLPLPAIQTRMTFGENLQLRLLQRLPSRFYMSSSVETSLRYETNPFQFPTKRKFLTQLPPPPVFRTLNAFQQGQILDLLNLCNNDDMVFRVLPNVTGGWVINPRTRAFCNYFMIRDSLFHNVRLNTVIHSISYGVQRDIPITSRGNLQLEFQARELYQLHQQPVFDFLPGVTFSYVATPRLVLFVNALLQMRGKRYFQAPTKEIDPFYTWGALYQRNGWTFSASTTFLQNFREPFRQNAVIPVNNYSFICDFEIARRLFRQMPGLQAFVRAEPIYNFHSHNTPGLAGVDFRLFFGLRMAMAKPALTATLEQLRQQLEEQEAAPSKPSTQSSPNSDPQKTNSKPSAYIKPSFYQLTATSLQPIHGVLPLNYAAKPSAISLPQISSNQTNNQAKVKHKQKIAKTIHKNRQKIAKANPKNQLVATPSVPDIGLRPDIILKANTNNASRIETKEKTLISAKPNLKNKNKDLEMVLIPPFPAVSMDGKGHVLIEKQYATIP